MELEIYEEKEEKKPTVKLKLIQDSNGDIGLLSVNKDGVREYDGRILTITTKGTLLLLSKINKKLGFKLDEAAKIEVE